MGLLVIRIILAIYGTKNLLYPDEYWQGTEIAYNMVYGGVSQPWEWTSGNRIRSHLYPLYLSIPIRILKFLSLDYYFTVRNSYYLFHMILVLIGDYYYYKVGCKIVGKNATRVSLYILMASKFYNVHIIRCLANSVETIIYIVAFNYYYKIKNKLDKNIIIFTLLIVVSFMMRCTSISGFILLVLYKIIKEKAWCAFIKSGFLVAIPCIILLVAFDTSYYA